MKIETILARKGSDVLSLRPEDTIQTAATLLATNKIGALPVRDSSGALVGILSERDIIKGIHAEGCKMLDLLVGDLMTRKVTTCTPDADVTEVQKIMDNGRFRHIPVVVENKLIGVVSLGDVVHMCIEKAETEANVMRDIAIARS